MRAWTETRFSNFQLANSGYSIKSDGTIPIPTDPRTEKGFNYKEAWEKTAVKVCGYEGVNVIGIDF